MGKKQKAERGKAVHLAPVAHRLLRVHAASRGCSMEQLVDELIVRHLPPVPKGLLEPEHEQSAA